MIQMRSQNAFVSSVHSIPYLGTISMLFYEYVAQMTLETKAAEKYTNAEGRIFFLSSAQTPQCKFSRSSA